MIPPNNAQTPMTIRRARIGRSSERMSRLGRVPARVAKARLTGESSDPKLSAPSELGNGCPGSSRVHLRPGARKVFQPVRIYYDLPNITDFAAGRLTDFCPTGARPRDGPS